MVEGRRSARASRLGALVLVLALCAGCGDEQDPGVTPDGDAPRQTSDTLGACPTGGPDATTPAAGCIDEGGRVQRP